MTEPVFLVALAMGGVTAVTVVKTIAAVITGRGSSQSEVSQLRDQVEQQASVLEDTQTRLASQSTQLSELHERLDFAERLLTQARDRQALGPGDKHG